MLRDRIQAAAGYAGRQLWSSRSLRQRLMLLTWLVVVPFSVGTSLMAVNESKRLADEQIKREIQTATSTAASDFAWWEQNHLAAITFLAKRNSIDPKELSSAQKTLNDSNQYVPYYSFFLTRPDGSIAASSGKLKKNDQLNDLDRLILNRGSASGILNLPDMSEPCYYHGTRLEKRYIISSCLALKDLGFITGTSTIAKFAGNFDPKQLEHYSKEEATQANQDSNIPYGLLLLTPKDLAITITNDKTSELFEAKGAANNLPKLWRPLVTESKNLEASQITGKLRYNNHVYYYGIQKRSNGDAFILILDQDIALGAFKPIVNAIWIDDIVAFGLIAILLYQFGVSMTRSFEQIGVVLAAISQGDFSQKLPIASGEVGKLFGNVNKASQQLESYLASSKAYAVTDAQLKEAQRIQADFLLDELPNSDTVELSASFDPAYQIGADWYDALALDGVTFGVVADVCDKGIPSALYMSVFRSLLRLGLERSWILSGGNAAEALTRTLTSVNDYMAKTHARSAMFATAFVFAYEPQRQRLSHVVAGHEQPLLWHDGRVIQLPSGGPALGLFETATFTTSQCAMAPGDLLLAFSDGLTDARNADGKSFGIERVKTLMQHLAQQGCSAEALRLAMEQAVKAHIGEAEQFDDLTLLTLKPLDPGQSGAP